MKVATKHPTQLVVFGATGNLAETKIFPSLFDLFLGGFIEESLHVVAFARKQFSDEEYRVIVSDWIKKDKKTIDEAKLSNFVSRIHYVVGNFDDDYAYKELQNKLLDVDNKVFKTCSNKLFYLAVPPNLYENILNRIALSGLSIPCVGKDTGWTRILIEKPFGNDLKTARSLDHLLGLLFEEEQIFRIDHYLAKETIQNILAFRFGNGIFEPLWNKDHIVAVDIIASELNTIGTRGAFYDDIGALKDVGQNHLLQMLALIAMPAPSDFTADSIRVSRAQVIQSLIPPTKSDVFRARYEGYVRELNIKDSSQTETAFAVRAFLKIPRWQGVPFFLGSGKGFADSEVSITVYFKRPHMLGFVGDDCERENALTFRIQPNEGITLSFLAKRPGFGMEMHERQLSFSYEKEEKNIDETKIPNAYERVLFDCIRGDQTLFTSTSEVDASWSYVASVIEAWQDGKLLEYKPKTSFQSWARTTLKEGFGDPSIK